MNTVEGYHWTDNLKHSDYPFSFSQEGSLYEFPVQQSHHDAACMSSSGSVATPVVDFDFLSSVSQSSSRDAQPDHSPMVESNSHSLPDFAEHANSTLGWHNLSQERFKSMNNYNRTSLDSRELSLFSASFATAPNEMMMDVPSQELFSASNMHSPVAYGALPVSFVQSSTTDASPVSADFSLSFGCSSTTSLDPEDHARKTRDTPSREHTSSPTDKEPPVPYAKLIYQALIETPGRRMVLKDIYKWFEMYTDKTKNSKSKGWQNSIRHNLSMNGVGLFLYTKLAKDMTKSKQGFRKVEQLAPNSEAKKRYIWVLEDSVAQTGIVPTTRFRKSLPIKRTNGTENQSNHTSRSRQKRISRNRKPATSIRSHPPLQDERYGVSASLILSQAASTSATNASVLPNSPDVPVEWSQDLKQDISSDQHHSLINILPNGISLADRAIALHPGHLSQFGRTVCPYCS